jgi:hypothetical protein
MKAAQVVRPREPLELKELPSPDPRSKQVVCKSTPLAYVTVIFTFGKGVMKVPRDNS